MKKSSGKKIQPVKEASSGARSILLNVMEDLARKDNDHALMRNVKRQRKQAEKK